MAREVIHLDINNSPDILRLAEEVAKSGKPRVLRRDSEDNAVVSPVKRASKRGRGRIMTEDAPILKLAGTGRSGIPGGISGRKYEFFKEAFGAKE